MLTADVLTEMLVGQEGAIRMPAKLVLRPGHTEDGLTQIGLWGAAASAWGSLVLPENLRHNEMWEVEIILLPRRKYTSKLPEARGDITHAFAGKRADQMLCGGYERPEMWGPCYFTLREHSGE